MNDIPYIALAANTMKNQRYTLLVYRYVFGQFNIKVTDVSKPDASAPPGHGEIVKMLCTYIPDTLRNVLAKLQHSDDPVECVESMRTSHNSEGPDDVVRLDTTEKDNPHRGRK